MRKSWRELNHLAWDSFPIFPEPCLLCVTEYHMDNTRSTNLHLTMRGCALVCLPTCFCPHTRPGLTLLQFAPLGTTMGLVCKDWRQTAALVCGIIQLLLPSPALRSHACAWGSLGPGYTASSSTARFRRLQSLLLGPTLVPCQNMPVSPFPTCFSKTAPGVL